MRRLFEGPQSDDAPLRFRDLTVIVLKIDGMVVPLLACSLMISLLLLADRAEFTALAGYTLLLLTVVTQIRRRAEKAL
jgi:hypothetical protein